MENQEAVNQALLSLRATLHQLEMWWEHKSEWHKKMAELCQKQAKKNLEALPDELKEKMLCLFPEYEDALNGVARYYGDTASSHIILAIINAEAAKRWMQRYEESPCRTYTTFIDLELEWKEKELSQLSEEQRKIALELFPQLRITK